MAVAANFKPVPHRIPFGLRLKAWWSGYDVVLHQRQAANAGKEAPARPVIGARDPALPWQTPRVILAQMLWGEGFSLPGGAAEACTLAKPFALDPAMTVVDLAAGLGGGARAIVEQFGVWVAGYEADRDYAAAGMQFSTQQGMGKKAEISLSAPDELEIRTASIDCVLCRQLLHKVRDKDRLLRVVEQALKANGQLVLTDYMLSDPSSADSPAVKAWLQADGNGAGLWSLDDYTRALGAQKMDVRVSEDITAAYRGAVLAAWADLTKAITGAALAPEFSQCMVDELERWMRLVAAIDSGDVKVFRIYALKASAKTLSDW